MNLKTVKPKIEKIIKEKYKELNVTEIKKIKISNLGCGENNLNFLVDVDNKKFVFRIGMKEHIEKNMKREFNTIKLLPENLGPKAIYFDDSKKLFPKVYSILSYVEGKHLTKLSKKHLSLHAKTLASLHKIKSNYFGNIYAHKKTFDFLKRVKKEIHEFKEVLDDEIAKNVYPKMLKYAESKNHLFTSMKQFHLIHSDPCLTNILVNKNQIYYIDWEWAKFGDPAKDVVLIYDKFHALLPWKVKLNEEKINFYLKEYIKYAKPDKDFLKRIEVWYNYGLFFEYIYFIWKIRHFDKEGEIGLSKKEYVKLTYLMGEELKKIWL